MLVIPAAVELDVLIVGAGAAGLTAAVELATTGVSIRIIDKMAEPARNSRALGIHARTMELISIMSPPILEELMKSCRSPRGMCFQVGKKSTHVPFHEIDSKFSRIWLCSQWRLEQILTAHLSKLGFVVERSTEFINCKQEGDCVRATLRKTVAEKSADEKASEASAIDRMDRTILMPSSGVATPPIPIGEESKSAEITTVACKYLLGCDGSHSAVRKSCGLSFEGFQHNTFVWMCDCKIELEGDENKAAETHFESGDAEPFDNNWFKITVTDAGENVGFIPWCESYTRLLINFRSAQELKLAARGQTQVTFELLVEEFRRRFPDSKLKFSDCIWVAAPAIHERMVENPRPLPGVFLCGDAAHVHSPVGGQGMNMGIQDAVNLSWKLDLAIKGKVSEPDKFLDSYALERVPNWRKILKGTGTATQVVFAETWLGGFFRNHALPLLLSSDYVQKAMQTSTSMIAMNYSGSLAGNLALHSLTNAKKMALRVGSRAPDVDGMMVIRREKEGGDGDAQKAVSLYDLLTESHAANKWIVLSVPQQDSRSAEDSGGFSLETALNKFSDRLSLVEVVSKNEKNNLTLPSPDQKKTQIFSDSLAQCEQRYGSPEGRVLYVIRPDAYIASIIGGWKKGWFQTSQNKEVVPSMLSPFFENLLSV